MENKYWVARDLSGSLFLTDNKPKRCDFEYGLWISKRGKYDASKRFS